MVVGVVPLGHQARVRARRTSFPRTRSRRCSPGSRSPGAARPPALHESIPPESRTPTGNVGDQMRTDRVAKPLSRARSRARPRLPIVRRRLEPARARVPSMIASRRHPRPTSVCPAGSLRASLKIVSGAGNELKARKASSAARSISRENPGCRSSAFNSEAKASVCRRRPVVERLDAEAVTRQHEPASARPRSRSRTSRAAPRRSPGPAPRRGGRGPRCRCASRSCDRALELLAQLPVVVDLAVLDHVDASRPRSRSAGRRRRGR